ncbi:MAG: Ppx/GppA phosphatase family protein [Lacisediminimonas sp.]|nr:Ppx/GppA phosphatase family protein [Lacisediminimonas sp.]
MFAAVDLGSNSFRLHIGEPAADGIRVVRSARDPVRLGAGLDKDDCLTPAAIEAALESLQGFGQLLATYPLQAVRVVGTNALRLARNADEFLPLAEKAIGYPIEVISGEEEGRLIYLGVAATTGHGNQQQLVVDIGGGSTELVLGRGAQILRVESFSIGTVRKNVLFFPEGRIDRSSFQAAVLSARSRFEDAAEGFGSGNWELVCGSSGTIRAVGDALVRNDIGDGLMRYETLQLLRERLIGFGHTSRIALAGLKPDRAEVISGGLAILIGLMEELGIEQIMPVQAGLRMGLIWDMHLRSTSGDRRDAAVQAFATRFQVDPLRVQRVAAAADMLYKSARPGGDNQRLLCWAAQLHEVGLIVSRTGFHKHGAYLVEHADLPGFSAREQRKLGQLVLAQKGNLRKLGNAMDDPDFCCAVLALRLATVLMHSHESDSAKLLRLHVRNRIEVEAPADLLQQHPTLSWWLTRERGEWEEIGRPFLLKPA